MAAWAVPAAPWTAFGRSLLRAQVISGPSNAWALSKTYFSTPRLLSEETPAMQALKLHPYPRTPLDTSLFEEASDEYSDLALGPAHADMVSAASTSGTRACDLLARLVTQQQWSDAERVRAELERLGVPIKPNIIYQDMAYRVLQHARHYRDGERVAAFEAWCLLAPSRTKDTRTTLSHLRRGVFGPGTRDALTVPIVISFGLIVASKGFAAVVAPETMAYVVRYGEPAVSSEFLEQFVEVAMKADAALDETLSGTYKLNVAMWYDQAIRTQTNSGRLHAAIEVLRAARTRNLDVAYTSYFLLTQKLLAALDQSGLHIVENLCREEGAHNFPAMKNRAFAKLIELGETTASSSHSIQTLQPTAFASESPTRQLALALCLLKRSIKDPEMLPLSFIISFIKACHRHQRLSSLPRLKKLAYRSSYAAFSRWVLAEMLLESQRNQPLLVLTVFANSCHPVGVPEELFHYVDASRRERRQGSGTVAARLSVGTPFTLDELIWPTNYHTALVWKAIVYVTPPEKMEELYAQFLRQVDDARAANSSPSPSASAPAAPPSADLPLASLWAADASTGPPPRQRFDSAHFHPFLVRFARYTSPQRALAAVNDMLALGVAPTVHNLTTILGAFARRGDVLNVRRVLGFMEAGLPAPGDGAEATPETTQAPEPRTLSMPVPNVITYTCVVRGLMDSKMWTEAGEIADRMRDKLAYTDGSNPRTDELLNQLKVQLDFETVRESPPHPAPLLVAAQ